MEKKSMVNVYQRDDLGFRVLDRATGLLVAS